MATYRKVDTRIWNDAKFREMSDDGKLAFLLLLSHPHMTALGAMRASMGGLAADLDWTTERLSKAFAEALVKGLAKHDAKACFVWLPNFLKYNRPESPNVVISWSKALDLLPECLLKYELIKAVKAFTEGLPEGFAKALPEDFRKSMPNQEQEQEQEQEQNKDSICSETAKPSSKPVASVKSEKIRPDPPAETILSFECDGETAVWHLTKAQLEVWQPLFPTLDVMQECREAMAWLLADSKRRKTAGGMMKFLVGWFGRSQNKGGGNGRATGQAGLFGGGQKPDAGRIRTGATGNAIQQAMAEAAAQRGGSSGPGNGAVGRA